MGPLTHWRGQSDTTDARLRRLVVLSLLLHTPLTPLAALLGLLGWLSIAEPPPSPVPPMNAIPVDLFESDEPLGASPATPAPAPAPEPALMPDPAERAKPELPPREAPDAGVADGEVLDAGLDAEADAAAEEFDAGPEDGGIADPMAVAGDAKRILDPNANVRVKIHSDKIRNHQLGPRIGRLLGSVYQWRDFFGPAALDPVRDVDLIVITAPQLRDSSEAIAAIKVNVPEARVRAAFDGLVAADPVGGAWLDAGVPAVTARADRAQRVFVMAGPNVVVVLPERLAKDALSWRDKKLGSSEGPEVVSAFAVTPWRILRGTGVPLEVSKSILWARAQVIPDERGGAVVEILAKDESAEAAAEHAEETERNLRALTEINVGILGALLGGGSRVRFVERIEFRAEGNEIRGRLVFTAAQVADVLNFASGFLAERQRAGRRAPSPSTTPGRGALPSPSRAAPIPGASPSAPAPR